MVIELPFGYAGSVHDRAMAVVFERETIDILRCELGGPSSIGTFARGWLPFLISCRAQPPTRNSTRPLVSAAGELPSCADL